MIEEQEERWKLEKTEALARHRAAVAALRAGDRDAVVAFAQDIEQRRGRAVAEMALGSVKACARNSKWK